jgi:hypothetical protein
MSTHWALKYIGLSYREVGMCWGLVQRVCLERHGIEMPAVVIGSTASQVGAIKKASRVSGWRRRRLEFEGRDGDIVVMTGPDGPHVGFAVHVDGELGLLHARYKGVCFDPWPELRLMGLHTFEFWRRSP